VAKDYLNMENKTHRLFLPAGCRLRQTGGMTRKSTAVDWHFPGLGAMQFRAGIGLVAAVRTPLLRVMRSISVLFVLLPSFSSQAATPTVHEGDIIFQTSRSSQSLAIQQATQSPYSHMGIILFKDGKPFVFEAIATVRFTPLDKWIERGQGAHYVLKRLSQAQTLLSEKNLDRLRHDARHFEGRPYDLTFEWSDQRIYCSELVWKLYKNALGIEVGKLQHLREFKLDTPAVKAKLFERYGNRIPLDEPVIAPKAMFNSPLLTVVAQQ
jgi:hypothetical protein